LERQYCIEVRKVDPRDAVINLLGSSRGGFQLLEPYLRTTSRPKLLEIGSGYGLGLCYLLKIGLDVIGVEPGTTTGFTGRFDKARELLELNALTPVGSHLLRSEGEALPFRDNSFDIVFSVAVLEHVHDVHQCMREALRVAKPGGMVIANVPNYNSFYEGHYNIFWLPYVLSSKKLARWYVRTVFGRSSYFIDELNFTTPGLFRKLGRNAPECSETKIYNLLQAPFHRISALHYSLSLSLGSGSRGKSLKRLWLKSLLKRGVLLGTGLTSHLLVWVGWSPVFNVVCRKRA
jgi:SAM-dependent methyltransferase